MKMLLPDERKNTVIIQLQQERKYWVILREVWRTGIDTADNSIKYLDEELKKLEESK